MAHMESGTLYIIGTPIGNLKDITHRALEILAEVDIVLCEDTRVTKKLLSHYDISTQTMSYHQHSSDAVVKKIIDLLKEGKNLALVTDAGTPGISDPGNKLIASIVEEIEEERIVPIPGASSVSVALSISGFPTDKFLFLGFPPHKNKRKKFFEELTQSPFTTVFFESNHRIKKALSNLSDVLDEHRQVCICRELTKKFETMYRGTIAEVQEMDIPEKGEFVVVINKKSPARER